MPSTEYRTSFLEFSLYLYILLCGFQNILHLPLLEEKLQVADLWFLVILLHLTYSWKVYYPLFIKLISNKVIRIYGILLITFLSIIFISCLVNYSAAGLLDCVGKLYLVILNVVFLACFEFHNLSNPKVVIVRSFIHLGVIVTVIGLIGWILSIFGIENSTTEIYKEYPYFGDTYRLRAYSPTASYYISIVTISIACALYEFMFQSKRILYGYQAFAMSCVAVLCFTKSFLFILLVWIFFYQFKKNISFKYMLFLGALFLSVHVASTHFLLIPKTQLNKSQLLNGPFASGELLYTSNKILIAASSYYQLKKTGWQIFTSNPWWGIGTGNFNQEIAKLKTQGNYPDQLANYDPHSTIIGSLAETGLFGITILIVLGIFYLYCLGLIHIKKDPFTFLLGVLVLIIYAEGISMDVLNFRHYWIVFALVLWNRIKSTEI